MFTIKRLFNYLKKYWMIILIIVLATYTQVQTELALPDYMSDIVTNGIQFNGVTDTVPSCITEKDMNHLLAFVTEEERNDILDVYSLVEAGTTSVVKNQKIRFDSNVYLLDETADKTSLETMMSTAEYCVYALDVSGQGESLWPMIEVNPMMVETVKNQLTSAFSQSEMSAGSVGTIAVRAFYENVGLSTTKLQSNYILHAGLTMLSISLLCVAAQLLSTYLATKIATSVAAELRKDVFTKVESFSSTEFSRFSTASLITRTTNDIQQVQAMIQMMLRMMLMTPMMGLTSVFKVLRYPSLAWILLIAIGVIICLMIYLLAVAMPKFKIIQSLVDNLNGVMRELLDGILVIRAFNGQKHEEKRFDEANAELTDTLLFVNNRMAILMPTMTMVMSSLTVLIMYFASKQIDANLMTVGDMMAFVQYAMHVVMSFMFLAALWIMLPRSIICMNRIDEVLSTENSINDAAETLTLPKENATLVFDHVGFTYPHAEEKVLDDISFTVEPGETVAIIGSTGSGKSTIVKLIPRLFDITEGSITYGGIDIRKVKQSDLRDHIGFASQKALLFTGSIRSNIEFGRDISEEEMNNAVQVSQSTQIIADKENGLDSAIVQGGTNVSGGQKQRLSIARALAKKASIYIFDDSFSALDYATDRKLRGELNEMIQKYKSSVIIVAQRISTIRNADKIIVLDSGKIAGMGKHDELLANCSVYQEIAYSQLSKEELSHAA